MTSLGWIAVGFIAGVGTTLAVSTLQTAAVVSLENAPTAVDVASPSPEAQAQGVIYHQRPEELIGADPLGELDSMQRIAMMRWMAANPQYEYITRDYCYCHDYPKTICPEFEAERIRAQSDYPYASAHDYNDDGKGDFAIMIARKGKEGPDRLLIFNGPFGDDIPTPAFSAEGWQRNDHVRGGYVGVNESDNGYSIKTKGATYELVYVGNPH